MKKIALVITTNFISCLLFYSAAVCQNLPNVILPSPEASTFVRYQDYPVDYSTGLPQINIPLYEVKSGSLTVPISLSYHAAGRRVYDQDGPVALGWALNAGGSISRSVHGAVDFGTTAGTFRFPADINVTHLGNANPADRLIYLEKMMHFLHNSPDVGVSSWTDGEYDIFSYSFGDHNGKFFFKDDGTARTQELIPYKPYIITPLYSSGSLTEIDIVDDKGVFYQFVAGETTLQGQSAIETVQAATGFNLRKIISADKTDTITFIYGYGLVQQRKSVNIQITWNDNAAGFSGNTFNTFVPEGPTESVVYPVSNYQTERLTEIDFKQGKIIFNLVSNTDKVDNIQVLNLNNEILKTIQINRSYLNTSDLGIVTNKLDSLVYKGRDNVAVENYSFQYFPFLFNDNAHQSNQNVLNERFRDYWGFYNASGVYNMIPLTAPLNYVGTANTYNRVIGDPDFNRSPNLAGLESGMLKKITYPTGGSTEFVFENNKYLNSTSHQVTNGPGMRISQMKTNDNNGTASYKTYTYGDNESGYGMLEMEPDMTNMSIETFHNHYTIGQSDITYYYRNRLFNSDFISPLAELGERPIIYTTVTEYHGTTDNNIGKTVYKYDYSPWAAAGMPANESMTLYRKHIYSFNYWNNPSLLEQTDYKTGAASPRKKITNVYNAVTSELVSGMHVQRVHELDPTNFDQNRYDDYAQGPPGGIHQEPYSTLYANAHLVIYSFSDYQIPVGYKNLTSSTQILYNDDGSQVVNTSSYTYNSRQYMSQQSVSTSESPTVFLNTNTTYPFDYSGNTVLTQMVSPSVNMLAFPVEQVQTKNTIPVSGTRTNYYNWGGANPMIKPQTIDTKKGSSAYETRIRYSAYDSYGNPLTVAKENDAPVSYLWDYKGSYPIAEVKNALQSDIAYTSFEADGKGNWNFAGMPSTDATAVTGGKVYDLANGTVSKNIGSAGTYVISYWSKAGSKTISGTTSTAGRTINGWTYYEHTGSFTAGSSVAVNGSGVIDELRLFPANAQMTSYTYDALIGQTSISDPNGAVAHYEYDPYQRLKLIRDLYGNILKTIKYQLRSNSSF